MTARTPAARYVDPLEHVWHEAARRIGLRVERTDDAYARTADRVLYVGRDEFLDPDDCMAQMVLHELCHSLVEGPESFEQPDWGLDNTGTRDEVREHASLRTQAWLTTPHGLRQVLAPTTDFREFYDTLPLDPLADRTDESTLLAVLAIRRAKLPPWAPHLEEALTITGTVARAAASYSGPAPRELPPLWVGAAEPLPLHPNGTRRHPRADVVCSQCAWRDPGGRCLQSDGTEMAADQIGCQHWEPPVDCLRCGACCSGAYQSVTIEPGEPVIERHPGLIVKRDNYLEILRDGSRCAALRGTVETGMSCAIYDDRPTPCREFEPGGDHCLTARRRTGLTL